MNTPVRLQLSRRKGFNLQDQSHALNGRPAVKVDRTTKWGNPFVMGEDGTREECIRRFTRMMSGKWCTQCSVSVADQRAYRKRALAHIGELKGRNLACWCAGEPCHASVLLKIAAKNTVPELVSARRKQGSQRTAREPKQPPRAR